jgi:hypothetical protein
MIEECNCTSCVAERGYEAPELTGPASEAQDTVMRRAFGLPS